MEIEGTAGLNAVEVGLIGSWLLALGGQEAQEEFIDLYFD